MKRQRHLKALSALLLLLYCSNVSHAQDPLNALYFPGSGVLTPSPTATTNSFVDLGTALEDSLALSNFTIELWVKMGTTNSVNPVIIGDKDWASGANTGFVLSYYASTDASSGTAAANTIRFNFKPASGTRVDYDISFPASIAHHWNHIAITVNRSGSIIGYLNGIATGHAYVTGGENISADAAKILSGLLPVRLGTDGKTNGYRAPFNGIMDEVRIWNVVRTPQELRDNMCHKLTGAESNLLAYYKMDETSGNAIVNNATATSGLFNGTWVNNMSRVSSSAPIGDVSVSMYATNLSDSSLSINTATHGSFSVSNMDNSMQGMQVYEIDATPVNTGEITNPDNKYYAVFPVTSTATYNVTYNYANYPDAVNSNNIIDLYRRGNADSSWVSAGFTKDMIANIFSNQTQTGASEFLLGNFNNSPLPLNLVAFNVEKIANQSNALLTWVVADVTENVSFEIERSSDAATFLKIGNVNATTINTDDKGNGNYQFTDAAPFSGTDFYRIKVVEKEGSVKYSPIKSIQINSNSNNISLFPNPADNQLTLRYTSILSTTLSITFYDLSGKKMANQHIGITPGISEYSIDISGVPNSIFFINVQDPQSDFQATIKMIKK